MIDLSAFIVGGAVGGMLGFLARSLLGRPRKPDFPPSGDLGPPPARPDTTKFGPLTQSLLDGKNVTHVTAYVRRKQQRKPKGTSK